MACGSKACKRATGPGQPADMPENVRRPHARIARRREPVEEPGIGLKIELRQQLTDLAIMQVKRQPAIAERHQMIARPARRQGLSERRRLPVQFREDVMGRAHLIFRQGELLNRDIVKLQMRMTREKRHHGKTVQAGTKSRFGNRQMVAGGTAYRQIIAFQKDMTCLGKSVLAAIIAILEIASIGNASAKADSGLRQVVNGTAMRRDWRHLRAR